MRNKILVTKAATCRENVELQDSEPLSPEESNSQLQSKITEELLVVS